MASVDEWNSKVSKLFIVNKLFLIIYIIVGFTGNLLVIIVYKLRLNTNKEDRYFIPWLAMLDFFAGTMRSCFELTRKSFPVMQKGTEYCKIIWMIINIFSFSSMLLLLVIAFHRYLKVCRPFGKQMTLRCKRAALLFTLVLSIVAAIPLNFYNSEILVSNLHQNVTGSTCDILIKDSMGVEFYVFISFASFMALIILIGLIVFYGLIGITIYHQIKMRHCFQTCANQHAQNNGTNGSTLFCLKCSHKFSYMLLAIAIGFGLSVIPQFIILFLEIKDGKYLFDTYEVDTTVISLIREMAILNHIINPFVYGFYDKLFQDEVKKLFKNCKSSEM